MPPLVLIVLDGFGTAEPGAGNAISLAQPNYLTSLRDSFPYTDLIASGEGVGLPCGLMGNSEVGHLNIGAGRVVWQDISRIDRAIEDGSFRALPAFVKPMADARERDAVLHFIGLVSDGEVHSSDRHLAELLRMAAAQGLRRDQVLVHAFLDGRDTPPRSAQEHLQRLQSAIDEIGVGRIASVVGRYWAMDRDSRWERVSRAWNLLTRGEGLTAESWQAAVSAAYERDEGDEFVQPTVIGEATVGRIRSDDAVICFNYRADRMRQLCSAFLFDDFDGFERGERPRVELSTMTRYRADFPCPVAFEPQNLRGHFGAVVADAGLKQVRVAETEKYAHVTFFFSGGDEKEMVGERRILVPSPKVATYDLQPAMSAVEVTERALAALDEPDAPDVMVINYANADMVGHTGVLPATIEAVRVLDQCLARLVPTVTARGGHVAITADHGNCELMVDPETGGPHTAHTTNPVPLYLVGEELRGRSLRSGGRLCDIVPTLLPILGLSPSPEMDGENLL